MILPCVCKTGQISPLPVAKSQLGNRFQTVMEVSYLPSKEQSQQRRRPRFRRRASAFADYTSTHGLPHIKRVSNHAHKAFWFVAYLAMVGGLLYQIITVTEKFLSNPYTVLVEVKFERSLAFPAVTICNANSIR